MPRPMCIRCGLSMTCHKNGQAVLLTHDFEKTSPYQLYRADVYECSHCGAQVAMGFGEPVEHFEKNFKEELKRAGGDVVRVF